MTHEKCFVVENTALICSNLPNEVDEMLNWDK